MGTTGGRWALCIAVGLGGWGCRDDGSGQLAADTEPAADDADDGSGDGADDGADTAGSDDGTDDDAGDPEVDFELEPAVLPRLTQRQYRNSVADLLDGPLPEPPLEPDTNPYLFYSIGATSTSLSELGVQQYEQAAQALTQTVFDDPDRREALVGCAVTTTTDPCIEDYVRAFGRRAFRRPLTDDEVAQWTELVDDVDAPDVWEALRLMTGGMLQSPYFIYRVEQGEPDPDDETRLRFSDYEMASRLSYLLWDTTPDDALLDAADAQQLTTVEGIAAQVDRMLESPRAKASVLAFFSQYFDLGRLQGVTRNTETYPQFNALLPAQMRTEVELLVEDVVYRRDADFRSIYSTRDIYVTNHLAALYGVDAPGATPIAFVPVTLPQDGPRAGLLTLSAFLTMNAHETDTSPTLRGKYVRERVLCSVVQAAPDDVDLDIDPEPSDEPQTLRQRLEAHRDSPACASCHAFIDPPGFLFENFDSLGVYRTEDSQGLTLDASGELDGAVLANARELGPVLADDPRVGACVVQQLYRHANGRLNTGSESAALVDMAQRWGEAGYRYQDLLRQFVVHDSFRYVAAQGAQ